MKLFVGQGLQRFQALEQLGWEAHRRRGIIALVAGVDFDQKAEVFRPTLSAKLVGEPTSPLSGDHFQQKEVELEVGDAESLLRNVSTKWDSICDEGVATVWADLLNRNTAATQTTPSNLACQFLASEVPGDRRLMIYYTDSMTVIVHANLSVRIIGRNMWSMHWKLETLTELIENIREEFASSVRALATAQQ